MYHATTKQKFKQLWKVSLPLMLSYLSSVGMMFIDRLFLAHYSLAALSATVSAGILAFGFTMGVEMITLISSVFVSQHNGAKNYKLLGRPVWQMIWFSLLSIIVFIPAGLYLGNFIFTTGDVVEQERLVFKCIMFISPLFALLGSLQSFYNGQELTRIVTYMSLIGNLVNAALDPIFIFGVDGFIPPLGIIGANLATGIGLLVQIALFLWTFLSRRNKERSDTWNWKVDLGLMWQCVRIGAPEALGVGIEVFCWGLFYNIMAKISDVHVLVVAVANSVVLLFFFFGIGLEQGCSVVVGNLIGADKKDEIKYVVRAGMWMIAVNAAVTVTLFILFPSFLIDVFFSGDSHQYIGDHNITAYTDSVGVAYNILRHSIVWIAVYLGIENIRWLINGVLRAGGDTIFLLLANVINIIILMIIPTYVVMVIYEMPVVTFFGIWIFFAVVSSLVSYLRFRRGRWLSLNVEAH